MPTLQSPYSYINPTPSFLTSGSYLTGGLGTGGLTRTVTPSRAAAAFGGGGGVAPIIPPQVPEGSIPRGGARPTVQPPSAQPPAGYIPDPANPGWYYNPEVDVSIDDPSDPCYSWWEAPPAPASAAVAPAPGGVDPFAGTRSGRVTSTTPNLIYSGGRLVGGTDLTGTGGPGIQAPGLTEEGLLLQQYYTRQLEIEEAHWRRQEELERERMRLQYGSITNAPAAEQANLNAMSEARQQTAALLAQGQAEAAEATRQFNASLSQRQSESSQLAAAQREQLDYQRQKDRQAAGAGLLNTYLGATGYIPDWLTSGVNVPPLFQGLLTPPGGGQQTGATGGTTNPAALPTLPQPSLLGSSLLGGTGSTIPAYGTPGFAEWARSMGVNMEQLPMAQVMAAQGGVGPAASAAAAPAALQVGLPSSGTPWGQLTPEQQNLARTAYPGGSYGAMFPGAGG